jgi:hypothetical protein
MLVWNAMPSMIVMMSAIFVEPVRYGQQRNAQNYRSALPERGADAWRHLGS